MSEITKAEWAAMKENLDDFCREEGIPPFKPLDSSFIPIGENMLYVGIFVEHIFADWDKNSDKDASKILVAGRKRKIEAIDWMLENMPSVRQLYFDINGREYSHAGSV
ncbi:hypothetical protein FACS1894107_07800 [Planctomycetales bacterium]|nr:hypothetical protein FACS1894107_07800 [Planctomycetales bacterium]GHS99950.1 hypothetical protein FACS1894108_10940 [Planctomycetales bacterium]